MAPAVEARSLSNLTTLAANPPQYPRNPAHELLQPLTLYIARVPGKRDVFLTPLKPRQKVVSSEDVCSSLYYLHLHDENEAATLGEEDKSEKQEANGEQLPHRRPVPPPHGPSTRNRSLSDEVSRKPVQSHINIGSIDTQAKQPTEKSGIHRSNGSGRGDPSGSGQNSPIKRRPLGPRLLGQSPVSPDLHTSPVLSDSTHLENKPRLPTRPTSERLPPLPPRGIRSSWDSGHASLISETLRDPFNTPQSDPATRRRKTDFCITLIRRDPSSGNQWNVGVISNRPDMGQDATLGWPRPSNTTNTASNHRPPLYLEIMSPGYVKFPKAQPDVAPIAEAIPGLRDPFKARSESLSTPPAAESSISSDGTFRRQLWEEGSSLLDRTLQAVSRRSRSGSTSSIGENGSYSDNIPDEALPNAKSKPKGYVFLSPWQGRCEFSTSGPKKSFKCKHRLPGNPDAPPVTVSELRPNLPRQEALAPRPSPAAGLHAARQRLSPTKASTSASLHWRQRSASSVEEELGGGVLDLSLGQEDAGGGFGGKRAKLGKLIIEDEGLKMLDLVVAANMAVWWSLYEQALGPGPGCGGGGGVV